MARRAVEADPLNAYNHWARGQAAWGLNRLAEAEEAYRRATALLPDAAGLHGFFANMLLSANKPAEAVAEAEREPDTNYRQIALPVALDAAGRTADAERAIAVVERDYGDKEALEIAVFYACRRDADRAIAWLTRWVASGGTDLRTLPNRVACLASLDPDPRYQALKRQMHEATLPASRADPARTR